MRDTYSVHGYGEMMADEGRMKAYVDALRCIVSRETIVLDIGAGPGLMTLIAAGMGARHVHAVEQAGISQLARAVVATSKYADHVTIYHELSTEIDLPKKADLIVSDLRGVLPLFSNHLLSIIDARRRLLAPEGRMIPEADTLWTAPVFAPELYQRCVRGWGQNQYGFDLTAGLRFAVNRWIKGPVRAETLIHEPVCWAELDYQKIENADAGGTCKWRFDSPSRCNGFAVWFDTRLFEHVGFSNAPGTTLIYKNAFFPLENPVDLESGDALELVLEARFLNDDYVWLWQTAIADPTGHRRLKFKQSTFKGEVLDPRELSKRNAKAVQELSEDGRIAMQVLEMMDRGSSLGSIAEHVRSRYGHRFETDRRALDHVFDLTQRFTA